MSDVSQEDCPTFFPVGGHSNVGHDPRVADKLSEKLDVRLTRELYERLLEEAESLAPPAGRSGPKDMKGEVVRAALVDYFQKSKKPDRLSTRQRQVLELERLLVEADPDAAKDWARLGGLAADSAPVRALLRAFVAFVVPGSRGRDSRSRDPRSPRPKGRD